MPSRTHSRLSATAATVLLLSMAALPAQWTQLNPTNNPGLRRAGAMAFDPVQGRLLLFGGLDMSPTPIRGDTLTFDGSVFATVTPATVPPARWGHAMATDTARQRIVVFGGRSPSFYSDSNDTWEWNGSDWQRIAITAAPPARHGHGLTFDSVRDRIVLFGGLDLDGVRADTWEYDGATWTQIATAVTPPAREGAVFVHDASRRVCVLHSGQHVGPPIVRFADTWEYDGARWREVSTASSPPARYRAAGVYDSRRSRVVTYGGYGLAMVRETWEYDGSNWTMTAAGGTDYATEMFAAFHPTLNRTLTFGGGGPLGVTSQAWSYQGPATASWGTFGQGCAGTTTPVLNALSLPVLGATFALEVSDVPAGTPVCLLAQGLSATTFGAFSLPLDLTPFGLPGCRLEVAADFGVVIPVTGTTAGLSFPIPNDPALSGLPYYAQALVPDAGATNGIGSMTVAGRGVLGS